MEKINIAELLKDCPKGTKLYSPIFGGLKFNEVNVINNRILVVQQNDYIAEFESDGRLTNCKNGECLLFPSKECRDWSKFQRPFIKDKFNINTLKPFDKVLIRDRDTDEWNISFFSHCNGLEHYKYSCINNTGYAQCIPYEGNEHLLGTTNDYDEFYKAW